jgi:hypothetical protein
MAFHPYLFFGGTCREAFTRDAVRDALDGRRRSPVFTVT